MMPATLSPIRTGGHGAGVSQVIRRTLLALALATSVVTSTPAFADAGIVDRVTMLPIAIDEDNMMQTWVGTVMRRYAYGMHRWIEAALDRDGRRTHLTDAAEIQRFQQQLRRATFSHFQYSWTVDGEEHVRIYFGVSGRSFEHLINPGYRGERHLVIPDALGNFFNTDEAISFSAAGEVPESDVTPQPPTPGQPLRGNDAEIKVLQQIMRDMQSGLVTRGGRLLGFVSQQPCTSCTAALRQFAIEADADVHINYVDGSPHSPQTMTPALAAVRGLRHVLVDELTTTFAPPVHATVPSAEVVSDDGASTSMCRASDRHP